MIISFATGEYFPRPLMFYIVKNRIAAEGKGHVVKAHPNPDFGNYRNATKLGWGFPNSHTYKVYLNRLFSGCDFYPPSMVINRQFVYDNKNKITDFIGGGRCILKCDKGHSGKNIFIVSNVEEVLAKLKDKDYWVLQKEIKPMLYNGFKFDLRIFHFLLRYGEDYYNILSSVGFVKTSVHKFKKDSNSPYGFLTNISFNRHTKDKKECMFEYYNFMNKLESNSQKRDKMILDTYNLIREYSKKIVGQFKLEVAKMTKKPLAQIMIYGPDIMYDENGKPWLLETNCSPGILIKGEVMFGRQKMMVDELVNNVILPILENCDFLQHKNKFLFIEKVE